MRLRDGLLALLLAVASASPAASQSTASAAGGNSTKELQPYRVRYQVSYRGMGGGQIEATLRRGSHPGQWLYETRAYPNLFGRIAVSPEARERSTIYVSGGEVRPASFSFDDGSTDTAKDVQLRFDWAQKRLTGVAEGVPIDLPLTVGTQDTASVQAAMLVELLASRRPTGFRIFTGKSIKDYRYWSEGPATVVTPKGQFDAVVWANQREGSTRMLKVWHVPELGYVPVQAIQFRKGRPEVRMQLVDVERPLR